MKRHIDRSDLEGKIIDIHSHCGISMKAYATAEYPYCQSVESLDYRLRLCGVDYGVTFPFSPELYFDVRKLADEGRAVPAEKPFSDAPYVAENRLLLTEIYELLPELSDRFMPFVMADPGRKVSDQIAALEELENRYPIYGLKISPVHCQSKVTELLDRGRDMMKFAEERRLPVLFHVTVHKEEEFSQASDTFSVIERYPDIRYCLAHCIGFDRSYLERAGEMQNVWVDTSALKIQVQATYENQAFMASPEERFDWDYSDHTSTMTSLVERFPETIIWGTDSPFYSFISRRMQGEGEYVDFRLKGTYEQEKAALDALPPELRMRAGSKNAVAYLFGTEEK